MSNVIGFVSSGVSHLNLFGFALDICFCFDLKLIIFVLKDSEFEGNKKQLHAKRSNLKT